MYIWRLSSNVFPEFLYHPHPSLHVKGLKSLCQGTKACFYDGRNEEFKDFTSKEDVVLFCKDICSVVEVLGHEHNQDQWRLFTDLPRVSLDVVLLHNFTPFVPWAHADNMKESHGSIKLLLVKIKYDEFKWKLCDLKFVAQLVGM